MNVYVILQYQLGNIGLAYIIDIIGIYLDNDQAYAAVNNLNNDNPMPRDYWYEVEEWPTIGEKS